MAIEKTATFNFSRLVFFAHLPGPFTHISQSLCIIILLLGRVVNLAIPLALGELIRIFDGHSQRSPCLAIWICCVPLFAR